LGLLSAVSYWKLSFGDWEKGFFDLFDDFSTNYMLPIGGFLTCLFAAYVMKDADRVAEFGSKGPLYKGLIFILKYITPVAVLLVILHGLELLPFMDYAK
jgi:NSS family neurotransmitter:Na+ symporter